MRMCVSRFGIHAVISIAVAALTSGCSVESGAENDEVSPRVESVASASEALTAWFANPTTYYWGNGVTNVFSGDFDGDGKWDIGVTGTDTQGDRNWYIFYGDGQGGFGRPTTYYWGNGVTNVFTGDFNGDGKWDIGVTGTATQGDRNWYIRYGDGHGNFGDQTTFFWGNGVTNVFTGDFDGDGKWDIGVTGTESQSDRNWYIMYGNGQGSFGRPTTYYWGNGAVNVFTGDFNGDGKWDIGVTGTATQSDRSWHIRYGDGQGAFGNESVFYWGNGATNAFTGDFDGDHFWDIGVTGTATQSDRSWYVYYNQANPVGKNYGDEATISVGYRDACAIKADNTVQCWGRTVTANNPVSPAGTFSRISSGSGGDGSCGIRTDGTLACWGSAWGQYSSPPAGTYTHLAVGRTFGCALRPDRTIACWGDNRYQQTQAPSGTFLGLAARNDFACGLREDLTLACWGYDANLFRLSSVPAGQFKKIAVAAWNACAIRTNGTLACWGKYGSAETPPGTFTDITGMSGPQYSYDRMCGIRTDGSTVCWDNGWASPLTVVSGSYKQLAGGNGVTCGVTATGSVSCFNSVYWPDSRESVPSGLLAKPSL